MPLPDALPLLPLTVAQAPCDILDDYRRRYPAATPEQIVTYLDGWDAGAFLSRWLRQQEPTNTDSAELGPAGRH